MSHFSSFWALAVLCLSAGIGYAQEFRSTLSGRVLDAQGAVVPGAKVVATQVDTGANHETLSSPEGQYVLPFLPPGKYRIAAEAPGFKRFVRDGIQISTNERKSLDLALELGQIAETVTVTADVAMLETSTASVGQVISSRQIENMPLLGRTPLVLAQLAFGVIPSSDPRFYRPFDNAGPSTFSMGGTPARQNELLLDGAPDTTGDGRVAYNPPMDAVSEVKVESFMADAAYGHTGGGTVNVVLKSGTNSFHGALYEFNQVSRTAATPFFSNQAGLRKQVTRFNQWGVNASGPLYIPRLLDGRNRVFYFFVYEGVRDSIPAPATSTVSTERQRNGDLSELLRVGSVYQVYDPLTGVREGARIRRQPFPNNIIPTSRINPIARNYLQFYPQPNQPGRADGQDNYLSNTNGEVNNFHNELGRLDFNISDRHKLFFNVRYNERLGFGSNSLGRGLDDLTAGNGLMRTNWGSTIDDVYTFTPTTVLNTRLGWTRFLEPRRNFSSGFDMKTLGFPASLAAASPKPVLPQISFDRFTGVGDTAGREFPYDSFQLFSSLTRIKGSHTLKIGTDLRWLRESNFDFGFASGRYVFGASWTRGPLDNSPAAPLGQDFAAFLLGMPTGGSFDINAARTNQAGYYAFFLQDDVRLRPTLTLNLGLRYERDLATTERFNRSLNGFDFTTANPIGILAMPAYNRSPIPEIPAGQFRTPGGPLFAGPSSREIYRTKAHYFSPRIGFAWTPASLRGTVVRGGAGVFFFPLGATGINQPGFSQSTLLVPTLDGFLTPNATLGNPFPNGIDTPPGASQGLQTFLGRSLTFFNPEPLNDYSVRWNLDIQREIRRNLVFEAGYMGNHAVHLDVNRQLNFVPGQFLSQLPVRDQPVIDRLTANVANPFAGLIPGTGLNGAVVQRQQLLRPLPHFTGVNMQSNNEGSSYFHMLQVRLEKRFAQGLQFLANYQFSRLIERRSRLNDFQDALEKRIGAEDRPQRLVFSGSYDLPFGRGKPFGAGAGPLVSRLIGGWVLNAIYTAQPGAPLAWGNVIYLGGDLNLDPHRVDGAFNTTRFNRNAREQLESNVRRLPSRFANLRGDSVNNVDLSVLKNTAITERVGLQYRCEFFNAFNRPQFDPPQLSPTNSNFGRITRQSNLPRRLQMALRLTW